MRLIKVREMDGHTEIEVETGFWIFKHITTYRTAKCIVKGYFEWLRLPGNIRVPDALSFQLDAWKRVS